MWAIPRAIYPFRTPTAAQSRRILLTWTGLQQQLQGLRWLLFHTVTQRTLDRTFGGHLLDYRSLGTSFFQTIELTTVASCEFLNVWLVRGAWTVEGFITSTTVGRYLKRWGTLNVRCRSVFEPTIDSGRWKVYITRTTSSGHWTTSFGLTQRPCDKDVVQLPHRSSSNLLDWGQMDSSFVVWGHLTWQILHITSCYILLQTGKDILLPLSAGCPCCHIGWFIHI